MTEKLSPLERYSRLRVAQDVARTKGMQLAPQYARELIAYETWANANLSPAQRANAARLSAQLQSQYQEQYGRAQLEAREKTAQETVAAKLQARMPGYTPEEIKAISAGKKIEPKSRETQAERDAANRLRTDALIGKGLTEKQWAAKLNELAEATPAEREAFARAHRIDKNDLNQAVQRWDSGGFLEYGLAAKRRERNEDHARRHGEPKQEAREPGEAERRRAQLAEASLQVEANELDEASERGEIVEDAPSNERLAGNSSMRAALAAAYDKVEANG